MLPLIIQTIGVDKSSDGKFFHIFAIGKNHKKIFFCEDGSWSENINEKAETDDFMFAFEQLASMIKSEDDRNNIEANILF